MDGDLCIEKILDAFDREYERSKAEHIDYFLTERQSLEENYSTSGSEDSGYTKQALEECLSAYRVRGCASASVVRYRQRLKTRVECCKEEDDKSVGVSCAGVTNLGGGVKRRLTRRARITNLSVRLTSAPALRSSLDSIPIPPIKTSVSLNDMPAKVKSRDLQLSSPPTTPPAMVRFTRHRKRKELPLKLEPVHFPNLKF